MPRYTMRRTWPDRDSPNDFTFLYDGKEVGRCYLTHIGGSGRTAWLWVVYRTSIKEFADTLAETQAKFKAAYEASEEFGKPLPYAPFSRRRLARQRP
jgi:hypothetical protein